MQHSDFQQQPRRNRSRWRWLVPFVLIALFVGALGFAGFSLLAALFKGETLTQGSVLELQLSGALRESPGDLAGLFPGLGEPPSLYELREAILRAAQDSRIAALKIDIEQSQCGWAQMEELHAAIATFRATGKPVHAFLRGDIVSDIDYALSLAADKVWIAPQAALFVNGLRAEVEFWRGTLDKLHIEPQYFMMKEYKSAGEVYSRTEMSEHFREATSDLIGDLWRRAVRLIADRRQLDVDAVQAFADRGLVSPTQAVESGLVDALGFEEDIRAALVEVAHTPSFERLGPRRFLELSSSLQSTGGQRIAVVFGEGAILASARQDFLSEAFHGPRVAAAIRRAADDDDFPAILFRINSPGGSPVGSDHVWRAIEYARTVRHKPVVVSFSNVAASGGYWVAMGADAIVAHETSITGSIGVVFGKLNLDGLYELAGANVDSLQTATNADLLSFVTSFAPAQKAIINTWMTELYETFKGKVASGRGLDGETVEHLARGRVWSGVDALEHGLVDRIGGYDQALEVIRERAQLGDGVTLTLEPFPKPPSLFEALFTDDALAAVGGLIARDDSLLELSTLLSGEPHHTLRVLRELATPGVWLIAPEIDIR